MQVMIGRLTAGHEPVFFANYPVDPRRKVFKSQVRPPIASTGVVMGQIKRVIPKPAQKSKPRTLRLKNADGTRHYWD